jgi:hypothetical protein
MPVEICPSLAWLQQAQEKGVIMGLKDDDVEFTRRIETQFAGISLDFLEQLASTLPSTMTTREIVSSLLGPAMARGGRGGRLWDYVGTQHKGRPSW